MGRPRYVFRSTWTFKTSKDQAFDRLRMIEDYPAWWPEVKLVEQIDDTTVRIRCRSLLPYDLHFTMQRSREDREAGILEVRLAGDLEGTTRWTITADGSRVHCVFDEDVVTNRRLLNVLAPIARPAFRLNHALMMRHGRNGLRRALRGKAPVEPLS